MTPAAAASRPDFDAALAELRHRVDVVFDLGALLWAGPGAPELPALVWALGNLPRGASYLAVRRRFLKSTDRLLLNCRADRVILERTLGETRPLHAVVPFAVDTGRFHPVDDAGRRDLRRRLGLDDGAVWVAFTGRLNVQKNVHLLLELLALARRDEPRLALLLVGDEDRTPLRPFAVSNRGYRLYLEERAAALGLGDRVRFAGAADDARLAEWLQASDLFASLSLHHDENFGFAPVEAMATGLPLLLSDWGGYRDLVGDGAGGFRVPTWLCRHGVRVAWGRAVPLLARLGADGDLRRRLGREARARAERRYCLGAFADRLVAQVAAAAHDRGRPARFATETFRFHPLALRLQARSALRHLLRERSGGDLDYRFDADDEPSYRFFIGPYASGDVSEVAASGDDRPQPLLAARLAEGRVDSLDPLWRHQVGVDPADAAPLLASRGERSVGDIAAASRRPLPGLIEAATVLARHGFVDLGRPVPLPGPDDPGASPAPDRPSAAQQPTP
jgi:glycosyltransferase involved in cell wall biosynthesis